MYTMARPRRMRKTQNKKTPGVAQLARRVDRLVRSRKQATQWLNLQRSETGASIAQFYWYNMMNFANSNSMFGTSADDFSDPKIRLHSTTINCRVSLENQVNNEEETTRFTAFLVSLKDKIPSSKFTNTSGALTLAPITDYNLIQGVAYLNHKLFKVHRVKRFTLTNYGTALSAPAAQSQFGTAHEWTWSVRPNSIIENTQGNWNVLSSAMDPSKQYYLLVFSDNQTGDLESPAVSINQISNFKRIASV